MKTHPVDKGWAWMVVVGAFFMMVLVVGGASKSFGILFVEFLQRFEASSTATSWIVALNQSLALLLGPLANALSLRFTARKVVFAGGFFLSAGFIISMFATSVYYLYFSYGVLVGVGSALAYAPSIVIVGMYFDKRRALANGIAVSGSGFGSFVIPPLITWLLDMYGLQGALMVLGAIMLNLCVCGLLLRPTEFYNVPVKISTEMNEPTYMELTDKLENNNDAPEKVPINHKARLEQSSTTHDDNFIDKEYEGLTEETKLSKNKKFDFSLLVHPVFIIYAVSVFLSEVGYIPLFIMLPDHAISIGLNSTSAAFLLSILGIFDLVGRIAFGWFFDLDFIPKPVGYSASLSLAAVGIISIPFCSDFVQLSIACGVIGLFAGSFNALVAVILAECLGVERLNSAFGLIVVFMGGGMLVAPPLVGSMRDGLGDWDAAFWLCGGSLLVGGLVALLQPLTRGRLKST